MQFKKELLKEYSTFFPYLLRMVDLAFIFAAGVITYAARFHSISVNFHYTYMIVFSMLFSFLMFPHFSVYMSWRGMSTTSELRRLTIAWFSVWTTLSLLGLFLHVSGWYSRYWLGMFFVLGWIFLLGLRIATRAIAKYLHIKGVNRLEVIILGAGSLGKVVSRQLKRSKASGFHVRAFFDDDVTLQGKIIEDVPVLNGLDHVEKYVQNNPVDEVWIALPLRAETRLRMLFNLLSDYPHMQIRFVPDISSFNFLNHQMSIIAGVTALNINQTPMVGFNRFIKALEDRLLAILILACISPVLLFISIAIKKTSKGPILFKQKRHGWDGKSITVYKFRTMIVHEDNAVKQATKNDCRITPLGSFLRRTSLDELPQFINVLQGRMSIVGPRPHAVEHNEKYRKLIHSYMLRHKVKPGITGWAQVNGWRGETDILEKMQKRVECDMYYIEHWSVFFDIKIVFLTLLKGFANKNAY